MNTNGIKIIHYPKLSTMDFGVLRTPGPGLGNLLFPVARALIGQRLHGGAFIYPTMRQIKIGPFLRFERDKRTYGDVLRPRSAAEWADWLSVRGVAKIDESEFDGSRQHVVVRYSGLGRHFYDLGANQVLIGDWLSQNVRGVVPAEKFDIGIHVRLGDFVNDPHSQGNSVRQPLEWYKSAVAEAARMLGGGKLSVVIFTDGSREEVRSGLGIKDALFDESRDALVSMMRLSQARLLIASRSTFSMWASYLGGMPTIWDRHYVERSVSFPARPGIDLAL